MSGFPVGAMLGTLIAVASCGGGGEGAGVPLVSTTLTGEYDGQAFTPAFGIATLYMDMNMIALGDGPLNCASAQRPDPPSGTNAVFYMPGLDLQTYAGVFVDMIQNKGNFHGVGSNSGTVTITAVSDTSVVGSASFSYTDSATSKTYGIAGGFEVTRCPM